MHNRCMQPVRISFNILHLALAGVALAQGGAALTDWQLHYRTGEDLLGKGRAAEARVELELALAGAGIEGKGAILDALGRAELEGGRYREAKRRFEASAALWVPQTRPWAVALNNLGLACLELQEYAHAEALLVQALTVLHGEARPWQSLGQAQLFRGRTRQSAESFQRALSLAGPGLAPLIASDLAGVLRAKRQYVKAAAILEEAIAGAGAGQARARMRANLGLLCVKLKDKRRAVEQLRSALTEMESAVGERHPDVAAILEIYQDVLRGAGQKPEAAAAARRAAEIRSSFVRHTGDRRVSVDWRDLR